MDKLHQHKRRTQTSRSSKRPSSIPSLRNARRSTAVRRDNQQPIKLRTSDSSWDTIYSKSSGLQPARDTGVLIRSHENLQDQQVYQRRMWLIALAIALILLIPSLLYYWMASSNTKGSELVGELSLESPRSNNTSADATSALLSLEDTSTLLYDSFVTPNSDTE